MKIKKKILIIDDEEDVITYLSAFFTDNGFITISTINGRDGFQKAKTSVIPAEVFYFVLRR